MFWVPLVTTVPSAGWWGCAKREEFTQKDKNKYLNSMVWVQSIRTDLISTSAQFLIRNETKNQNKNKT